VPKKSSSKGKGKDPITGRTLQFTGDGRTVEVQDDVVYEVIDGSPDTMVDDVIRPLKSIPTGLPQNGVFYAQFQLGDDAIMMTRIRDIDTVYRDVLIGSTAYNKRGKASIGTYTDTAFMQTLKTQNPDRTWGVYEKYSSPYKAPASSLMFLPPGEEVAMVGTSFPIAEDGTQSSVISESGGGLAAFRALGGGKFFYEGWQLDPFNTSII
jgi:hypothetical protein